MYDVALTVRACLRAGTQVHVAWAIDNDGFTPLDPAEALAITPGGGRVGSVLSGSLNDQLADLAATGSTGRFVELSVSEVDAMVAGLSRGGSARCLIVAAADLPEGLWDRLVDREAVCLVTRLEGDRIVVTEMLDAQRMADAGDEVARLFEIGASATAVDGSTVVTVLSPTPRLVVVGAGAIVEALVAAAGLLGWRTQTFTDAATATANIVGLSALDKLVVFSHDVDASGTALRVALSSQVGYVGAIGSRRLQEARVDWLTSHGVNDLSRIHGPAGLDIGAEGPAEIAVSILAEAIAAHAGRPLVPGGLQLLPKSHNEQGVRG